MIEAYVYKVENKITGEFYFGYRYKNQKLNVEPDADLWINYFTSSSRIQQDIAKYGVDAFTASIEYRNTDSMECWKEEQRLIKQAWGNSLLLNGKYHETDSNVEVYRRVNVTSDKTREKMSRAGKGRPKSEEHKRKIALANTGQKGSAEKSRKISLSRLGKAPSNKGVSPPKVACPHCGKEASVANIRKWHNDNCKMIDPEGHAHRSAGITNLHASRSIRKVR